MPRDTEPTSTHEFLTDIELAAWLRVSRVKLQQDRSRGQGPPYIRVGRAVRYRRSDVEAWLAEQRVVAS